MSDRSLDRAKDKILQSCSLVEIKKLNFYIINKISDFKHYVQHAV